MLVTSMSADIVAMPLVVVSLTMVAGNWLFFVRIVKHNLLEIGAGLRLLICCLGTFLMMEDLGSATVPSSAVFRLLPY